MKYDRKADKHYLLELCKNLSISARNLKVDPYRVYFLQGRRATIQTDGKWWYFTYLDSTKTKWKNIKLKLSFMTVSQDGDDEGILKLDRMPTKAESELIRKIGKFNLAEW